VAAGVGEVNAGAQRGIQNGLAFLDLDDLAERFNGELVAHGNLDVLKVIAACACQ
jgi:hypothetical protein